MKGDQIKYTTQVFLGREEVRLAERDLDRFVTYVHNQIRFKFEVSECPEEPTIWWEAKIMQPDGTYVYRDWEPRSQPVPDYLDSVIVRGQHTEVQK